MARAARTLRLTKQGANEIAFIGDSITQGWESAGKETWVKIYAPCGAANFGFSGDQTQHVLWRLQNGEVIAAKPKVVVPMIGTNNVGGRSVSPAKTAEGIAAIVGYLGEKLPETKVLLLGVFPRGETASDPLRIAVGQTTASISRLHDGQRVHLLNIGRHFQWRDGALRTNLMPDRLHLSAGGYEIWAKAMESTLAGLL
ncbi:MAG: GDSL-type esterase/lipase family protein [Fimbriimonadales bacterium]